MFLVVNIYLNMNIYEYEYEYYEYEYLSYIQTYILY